MSNRNQGIPGIPLGVLDAISDENTRTVLRALVDGLNVRNGLAGKGNNAFVTRDELDKLQSNLDGGIKTTVQNTLSATNSPGSNSAAITPGEIDKILGDLQTQIINTELFRDLGERIDWIDKPGGIFDRLGVTEIVLNNEVTSRVDGETALQTSIANMGVRVGSSETAIQTEIDMRVNADNAITIATNIQYSSLDTSLSLIKDQQITTANDVSALTTKVTTVQAGVGNNKASIQQEMTARADLADDVYAQYTLKVETNGIVSGFGLASNNGAGSDFFIRADKFAISSTSFNLSNPFDSETTAIPFIVTTSPQVINGETRQPGVYIKDAMIGNAAIDTAKIRDAAVDTLKIMGNAVTVPMFVKNTFNTSVSKNTSPFQVLATPPVYYSATAGAMVMAQVRASNLGGATNVRIVVKQDNAETILDRSFSQTASWTTSHVTIEGITIYPGWHTFQLLIGNDWGSGGPWILSDVSLLVLGVKK